MKMIVRNRQAIFWALVFPLVFVVFFAVIGSFMDAANTTTIGVVDHSNDVLSQQLLRDLHTAEGFEVVLRRDERAARLDVQNGDLRYLLIIPANLEARVQVNVPTPITLLYDEGQFGGSALRAIERFFDRTNLALAGIVPALEFSPERVSPDDVDFRGFVLPGIVLWGIMTNSIIGIAVALANFREKKILRRIKVSPLRARTFFAAQVSANLVLSLVQAATLFGLGSIVMQVSISGNLLVIGLLVVVCNVVFLNIGFIVGAFSKTGAAASGMGNVVVVPLVMLSGVFFPIETFPGPLADAARFLPLSPMVELLRGVAISGGSILDFTLEAGLIAGWVALTSVLAIRIFKFE